MPSSQLNAAAERLRDLGERRRQLLLVDSHEEAGNLSTQTAAAYRLHVLRGGSIFGLPLDGPNAAEAVAQWEENDLDLARASLRSPNIRAADAETRRLERRLLRGDRDAAFVRLESSPERRPIRPSARAPRRRSVRTSAKARSPGSRSSDDDPPHLEPAPRVIGVGEFLRQLAEAGL